MNSLLLPFQNIELVYFVISLILSLGLIVSTCEDLVNWKVYCKNGLLSWEVSKHSSLSFVNYRLMSKLGWIFNDRPFHFILISSLALSVALLLSSISGITSPLIPMVLLITRVLILMRSSYGLDGAFQMNFLGLLALTIGTLSGIHTPVAELCVWFLAGELTLSYLIAGVAKMRSPLWRKSYALNGIFSTRIYGHEAIYHLVTKHSFIPLILCWGTLVFELGFPMALLSQELCIMFCLAGIGFHLFNAIFMGLNTFLFSFLATYPAFIFCMLKLQ